MRITNSMMVSQFLSDANSSLSRVGKYQDQVNSTKKISNISDDPQATITALKARNKLSNLSLYQSNISTASSYLKEAESANSELDEVLQSAYEDLISAQSGSKTQVELNVIAEEIKNLRDEILSIANTTMGTSYIFGGSNFTGSTDGVTKTAPFSVNETTGDLIYNGINLSQFAWKDEFDSNTALMPGSGNTIVDIAAQLGTTTSDAYAKGTLCKNALTALKNLAACGENALKAAQEFGIDPSDTEYGKLAAFMSAISATADELSNELSKEIAGDYILESDLAIERNTDGSINTQYYQELGITVMSDDEYNNRFSIANAQGILDQAKELIGNTNTTTGVGLDYDMASAITGLGDKVVIASDVETAFEKEMGKQTQLQIGTTQSVDFTYTGIDLLGEGSDNVYHILDKCIDMLSGKMSADGLSGMITAIQDAQSNVLTMQTKIGSTQNRLDLISNRYTSSELNYKQMKSEAEDVDMAEAIINFTTAKTVYSAALAAGSELIQISLIDFIR